MDVRVPNYLYKYLPLNREFEVFITEKGKKRKKNGFDALEDILVRNRIYYSTPRYFNDPLEMCGVVLRLSTIEKERIMQRTVDYVIRSRPEEMNDQQVGELIQELSGKYFVEAEKEYDEKVTNIFHRMGYICLCADHDSILMWSYYADAHAGVCLRFRGVEDPFYSENGRGRMVQVRYSDTVSEFEVGEGAASIDAVFEKISRKAMCWEHEREYRVFRVPSNHRADDAQGERPFNSELVDAVYLGIRISDESRSKVLDIVRSATHKISVYEAFQGPYALKIEFRELDSLKSGSAV